MIDAAKLFIEVGADTADAERDLKGVSKTLDNVAKNLTRTGGVLTAAIGVPLVAVAAGVFKAGSSFESAFTGVIKTVDATESQIAGLRDGIRTMSREIPVSANALADVAAAAGQLGIETNNILSFTRVMADLGVTTDLSAENAATSLARLANITQMPQEDFDRLGSTIVALGNNLATTESEIVAMGLRIAAAGNQVGMSEAQILGLAGALSSVGIEAEAGGSAVSRVIIDMANAVASGDKRLSLFAATAGMSGSQFERAFKQDAAGALVTFIGGLNKVSMAGGNVFEVLDQLGLGEIRVRDALLRAAGAGGLFSDSLNIASGAWEENIALTKEAETRYGTVESKLQLIGNSINDIAIGLYDRIRPKLVGALDGVSGVVDTVAVAIGNLPQPVLEAGLAFLGAVAGTGALMLALGGLAAAVGAVSWPLVLLAVGVGALAAAWTVNWGDIQTKTSDAVALITPEIDKLVTKVGEFGSATGAAFTLFTNALMGKDTSFREQFDLMKRMVDVFGPDLTADIANAGTSLGAFGKNLQNLGSYIGEVVTSGESLNVWLFTMSPEFSKFAFNVGKAVVAVQGFATNVSAAFANTQFPTLQSLWDDFKAGDFKKLSATLDTTVTELMVNLDTELNITATATDLKQKLIGVVNGLGAAIAGIKLPTLSELEFKLPRLAPIALPALAFTLPALAPIRLPAPRIIVEPPKQAFDFNWEAFGAFPAKIARGITAATLAYNWTGTGEVLGTIISGWFQDEIKKARAWSNLPKNTATAAGGALAGVLNIEKWFTEFSVQLGKEISAGWTGANSGGAFAALGGAIKQGLDEMIDGLVTSIMGSFINLSFDPKITKGPDPILSQQKNLLNPMTSVANTMFTEFFTAFTASASATARQMVSSIGGFFTGLGTSFLTGISSLGTQLKEGFASMLDRINPFAGEGAQGRGGKPKLSLRPGESDQSNTGSLDWTDFIEPLAWPNFITLLQWEAFVPYIYWGRFIPHVEWGGFVPDVSWGDWVPTLDWGRFVPAFGAPQSAFASGTNYAPGGYALVGERGAELVDLPRGSRVYNNRETREMLAGANGVTINVHVASVGNDMDVHALAAKLAREFQRRTR